MVRAVAAIAGLIALVAPGAAPAQDANPPAGQAIDLSRDPPNRCKTPSPGELVVCGERGPSPYRLDPTVLDAQRSREAANNPARVQDRSGAPNLCGTVRNECGGAAIPLLEPALRAATAVVMAVEGDDWRQAFRNGPSDYDRYEQARQKKSRIGISISVSSGNGH